MIAGVGIQNFTAFGNLDLPLSPRGNVVIGSNRTGKTHLLKSIYRLALAGQPSYGERSDNEVTADLSRKLLRDSYTFLHLMERDTKPFKYVALLGLDEFDPAQQKALLTGYKDRLPADIRCKTDTPWRRHHIADCVVRSVDIWNKTFADWPMTQVPAAVANGKAAA
jgi:hypothetical protein